MHLFHKYRNWELLGDKHKYPGLSDLYYKRYWQGTCTVCGRPKIVSHDI